jgi:serine/threonine-protein kinase RIO1
MKPKTYKRRFSKKRKTCKRKKGGTFSNLSAINLPNNHDECSLPGMTRDAIQEKPDSALSQLLNEYGPTFTCTLSDKKGCPSYRQLKKMNQKGVFGSVFTSCCNDSCNYVTKVVYFKMYNNNNNRNENNAEHYAPNDINAVDKDEFMNELWMQAKAASIGVAPPIRKVLISDSRGIVIMDRLSIDLEDVMQNYAMDPSTTVDDAEKKGKELADQIGIQIKKLHNHNIVHGDLHQNNIMFDEKGNCKIIDYGMAMQIPMEFLAEQFINNTNGNMINSKIMDAYYGDYKISLEKTLFREYSEKEFMKKDISAASLLKFRVLFHAMATVLDEWLEDDTEKLQQRLNKYIKAKNL